MKNHKEISETTDNNKEYKLTTRQRSISCPFCLPNRGCNRKRAPWKRRSWKNYRKTQNKEKRL